ncbi:hypothetical protein MKX07_002994 [Trichoderma sp. CBMAI-0711]|nr:hypothetical protein MKX07_002994 [Trichoderma sp. CBMAI-0711]
MSTQGRPRVRDSDLVCDEKNAPSPSALLRGMYGPMSTGAAMSGLGVDVVSLRGISSDGLLYSEVGLKGTARPISPSWGAASLGLRGSWLSSAPSGWMPRSSLRRGVLGGYCGSELLYFSVDGLFRR